MGVKGLWRLLMPIGRRISIESLEGKILAIDASIWLTQFLKAMRDPDSGSVRPAAHLIGFFRRLCKLRFQGIRPVFVFDGATPEIKQREVRERRKRREQFSSTSQENSVDAVQRMAKRILMQQLRKRGVAGEGSDSRSARGAAATIADTTTGSSSYAPGFYDPKMDNEKAPAGDKAKLTTKSKEMKSAKDAEAELVEILEDETDYLEKATSRISRQSDWDVVVIDQSEASKMNDDKGKSRKKQKGDINRFTPTDPNDFNVGYVATMPSTQRKEVVEKAQRNRRLQSRREFMKVAYDPEGLSKCQLRNFLRSTKLNKDIHKMAREVANAEGVGGTLASDRTKKIIFETDGGQDEDKKRAKKEKILQEYSQNRKLSVMASSDNDSDDEIEWQDCSNMANNFQLVTPKARAIVADDESASSDDVGGIEGGFLTKGHSVSIETDAQLAQELQDEILARALQDADSDEESGGGVFFIEALTTVPSAKSNMAPTIVNVDDESIDESDQKMPARRRRNPEMVDAEIVSNGGKGRAALKNPRATQDENTRLYSDHISESDGGAGNLVVCENPESSHKRSQEGIFIVASSASLPPIPTSILPGQFSGEIQTSFQDLEEDQHVDKHQDEEIDWEDGDNRMGAGTIAASTCHEEMPPVTKCVFVQSGQNIEEKTILSAFTSQSANLSKSEVGANSDDDDDEGNSDIEWEDGSPAEGAVQKGDSKASSLASHNAGIELKKDEMDTYDMDELIDGIHDDKQDALTNENPFRLTTESKNKKSKEMAIALEHAQATAANLTNWAGRAFRRAVTQHATENNLEVPAAANPSVLNSLAIRGASNSKEETHFHQPRLETVPIAENAPSQQAKRASKKNVPKRDKKAEKGTSKEALSSTLGEEAVMETLEAYQEKWAEERNQQERDMDTVTDEMRTDVMQLLRLFGVPYVEAPAEAEAQCVTLEKLGLVDGVVTEDSDAFVFGGRRVYKNIFDDQKYVEVYDANDAESEMNLTHDGLVALAMLMGGDYTEGVKGVGIVNGMEIIQAFDISEDLEVGLTRFRKWLDGFDPSDVLNIAKGRELASKENEFHRKHHTARTRWIAPKYFPDPKVLTAYLHPVVDISEERFSWGVPDMERLILFCNKHIGWTLEETRHLIQPVVEKIESSGSTHQTRIDSFMRYEDGIKFADVRSKRLRDVILSVQNESKLEKANKKKQKTADE